MATAEEKQSVVAAKQAEVQAVVAQRSRRESGNLPAPKMRAAGDLSRYNIGYTDDPYAVPFTDLSGSPGELPPPTRVEVAPASSTMGGGSGGGVPRPPRRPRTTSPTSTAPRPPRVQPGTTQVRTPSGGYRTVSEGKVPQSGALYETNPKTTVTTPGARQRLADIQKGKLERSTPAVQSVTSSTGVTRKVSSGKTAQTGMMYEGKGGVIASAPKKAAAPAKPVSAKTTVAKAASAAKPAKPVSTKAVKK